jgi:drug/metabolite transporter (DMT)-like permease
VISVAVGLAVVLPVTVVAGDADQLVDGSIWPYYVAGLLAPGAAQLCFVYAVAAIGAARSATLIGAAPLLAIVPAFLILDEPLEPALPVGAVLIVAGAVVLSGERIVAADLRRTGFVLALGSAALIAVRDNFVRSFAREDDVTGLAAATAALAGAAVLLLCFLVLVRRRRAAGALERAFRPFVPAGLLLGAAYVMNLEALTRGRVTVVTPFYGTEALWAVLLAAVFLGGSERIGARVVVAAVLMGAGAALIGAFR